MSNAEYFPLIDRLVGAISPAAGLKRFQARSVLNHVQAFAGSGAHRSHEAAQPSRNRKCKKHTFALNPSLVFNSEIPFHLHERLHFNHDIAQLVVGAKLCCKYLLQPDCIDTFCR